MGQFKFIICILITAISTINVFGKNEPTLREDSCGFRMGDSLVISDNRYPSITDAANWNKPDWKENFHIERVNNKVIVKINENYTGCGDSNYFSYHSYTVTLGITYWDANFVSRYTEKDFVVSYDPSEGKYHIDKSVYTFTGAHRVKIEVLSAVDSIGFLCISTEMDIERYEYFDHNYSFPASTLHCDTIPATRELQFSWNHIDGAEEYELEWTFVSNIGVNKITGARYTIQPEHLYYSFENNSGRISTAGYSIRIDNIFESGYLLYRVRGIGRDTGNIKIRIPGAWSEGDTCSFTSGLHGLRPLTCWPTYIQLNGHEESLNWQYTLNFAEEGKHKGVIGYFDGSLRKRQSVTKTSTDKMAIVQESFYDHIGRPAVDILPVPAYDSAIKYYSNFNRVTTTAPFTLNNFDTGNCSTFNPASLNTISGASNYYSSSNSHKNGFQAYVPDAEGFPYTQKEYTPDNTGRIRKEGGVGPNHKLKSGHETRYYYGTPSQFELNRLFATEVGYADHYKKNMVVDANGQVSVSYLDMQGKVIATALAGRPPSNLDKLSASLDSFDVTEEILSPREITLEDRSVSRTRTILVSTPGNYVFDYHFIGEVYKDLICLGDSICYDCVYDLNISLLDECGQDMVNNGEGYKMKLGQIDSTASCDTILPEFIISADSFTSYLDVGSYNLSYSLSINEEALNYFTDKYIIQNKCIRTLDDFIDSALLKVDTTDCIEDSSFYIDKCKMYKEILMMDVSPGGQYCTFDSIDSAGNVFDHISVLNKNSYLRYYDDSRKKSYDDISAYFDETGQRSYVIINGEAKEPFELSPEQYILFFEKSWADSLIKFHPEYCVYEWCLANYPSNKYDESMLMTDSFAHAYDSGFFKPIPGTWSYLEDIVKNSDSLYDPYYQSGGFGYDDSTVVRDHYFNYMHSDSSIWELAYILTLKEIDTAYSVTCPQYANYFSKDTFQLFWERYRAMYLSEKQKMQELEFNNYIHNCNKTYDSIGRKTGCDTNWKNKNKRFPGFKDVFGLEVSNNRQANQNYIDNYSDTARREMQVECEKNCESYVAFWMDELKDCIENISDSLKDSIRKGLLEVCAKGCVDRLNPFGSIDLPEDSFTATGYNSFDDVLIKILGAGRYDTLKCSSYKISFPMGYNHKYFPDTCVDIYDCILKAMIKSCKDYRCETFHSTDINCTNLNKPDEWALEFQLILNELIDTNKLFGAGVRISDMGTQKYQDRKGSYCEYEADSNTNTNSIVVSLSKDYENAFCAFTLQLDSGDVNKLTYSEIDSFRFIRGDSIRGFKITAYITSNMLTDSFVFHSSKTPCFTFGDCIRNEKYTTTCTYNQTTIVNYFNHLFVHPPPGLTTTDFYNLLCYFSSDTFHFNLDSLYKAAHIVCNNCLKCNLVTSAMQDFHRLFPWLSDTMQTYYAFLSNYMNRKFNYSLIGFDYYDFYNKCSDTANHDSVEIYRLCDQPIFEQRDYRNPCKDNLIEMAVYRAGLDYNQYIDSIKKAFQHHYISHCMSSWQTESLQMTHNANEYHYTLYYYDLAGNLVKTVPPAGVVPINDTATWTQINNYRDYKTGYRSTSVTRVNTQHSMASLYKFNSLNSVTRQFTPDADSTHFWYDRFNRLKASRNARQNDESPKQYSYTRYDYIGRIVETGELSSNSTPDFAILNHVNYPENWGTMFTQVTKTFYDTAYFVLDSFNQENLRNRVASTCYYPAGKDYYNYASHYSYDIHGNVNYLMQENRDLFTAGHSKVRIDYDFDLISGKVNQVWYQKNKPDQMIHKYSYDADNRITDVETSMDGYIWDKDAKYFYYEHGPLARAEIGDLKVQGIDYAYTIQGWLKGVNSNTLYPDRDMGQDGLSSSINKYVARDAFGYTLGYFSKIVHDYIPVSNTASFEANVSGSNLELSRNDLFNGNISHMITSIEKLRGKDKPIQGTAYKYDQLNRIKRMDVFRNIDTASNEWQTSISIDSCYNTRYQYDANGNILSLYREGTHNQLRMDELTYHYASGTNKLLYIDDQVPDNYYTTDLDDQSSGNYVYDKTGNLIRDAKEGISINWNVYGKVKKVIKNNGQILSFAYDPTGNRIEKRISDSVYYFYTRDAQGNMMAVYTAKITPDTVLTGKGTLTDQTKFIDRMYHLMDTFSLFYSVIKPCLSNPVKMDSIRLLLNSANFSSATVMILKNIKDTIAFGELAGTALRDLGLQLDANGDTINRTTFTMQYKLTELDIYGSSRLGLTDPDKRITTKTYTALVNPFSMRFDNNIVTGTDNPGADTLHTRTRGKRQYELANHLGNVLSVVTDRKLPVRDTTSWCLQYFKPDIRSAADYYPFGSQMPDRTSDSLCMVYDSAVSFDTSLAFSDDFASWTGLWYNSGSITAEWDTLHRLHVSTGAQNDYVYATANVVAGKYYSLKMAVKCGTASSINVEVYDSLGNKLTDGSIPCPTDTLTLYFTPAYYHVEIRVIRTDAGGTEDFYLENVELNYYDYLSVGMYSDDFTTWSGLWSPTGTLSATWDPAQRMYVSGNDQNDYVYTSITVVAGDTYDLQLYVDCSTSSGVTIEVWDGGGSMLTSAPANCPSGIVYLSFTPSSTSIDIRIVRSDPPGMVDFYVDDVQLSYRSYYPVNSFKDNFTANSGYWNSNGSVYMLWNAPPRMHMYGSDQGTYVYTNVNVDPNKTYHLNMDVDCGIADTVFVEVYDNGTLKASTSVLYPNGHAYVSFVPANGALEIRIKRNGINGVYEDIYVDDVYLTYEDTVYSRYNFRYVRGNYRFGFNGKEMDDEVKDKDGTSYDFGARLYDPRVGRWWSVDKEISKGPELTPYNYSINSPILMKDNNGKWPKPTHELIFQKAFGKDLGLGKITQDQYNSLLKGSRIADSWKPTSNGLFGNQSDKMEFIHGMSPKGMDKKLAVKLANKWIDDNIDDFVVTGNYEKLGMALHTVADITCPTHRDKNGVPLELDNLSDHVKKENPDKIIEKNGTEGYISIEDLENRRDNVAPNAVYTKFEEALKRRKDYLEKEEKKKNNAEKNPDK
jgi:RHS repeat-associated protein